jgi:hypothetical protein
MAVTIRTTWNWDANQLLDVETVAHSVASVIGGTDENETVAIVLAQTNGEPMAVFAPTDAGEFQVLLAVDGPYPGQLVYQFAHEYCHVLADPRLWTKDEFTWVEEVLCEAASQFALLTLARRWLASSEAAYASNAPLLAGYADDHLNKESHKLPQGTTFPTWLGDRLPLLATDFTRRQDNVVIAAAILPVFEANADAWGAVRHFHGWNHGSSASLRELMNDWRAACPPVLRSTVDDIAAVICAAST